MPTYLLINLFIHSLILSHMTKYYEYKKLDFPAFEEEILLIYWRVFQSKFVLSFLPSHGE